MLKPVAVLKVGRSQLKEGMMMDRELVILVSAMLGKGNVKVFAPTHPGVSFPTPISVVVLVNG